MWRIVVAAIAAAVIGVGLWYAGHVWRPSVSQFPLQGVDVSADQGEIAWPTVKARGAVFAYLRATDGDEGRDPRFASHWQETAAAGLRRGAMHRFSLCRLARDQATNFLSTVPRDPDALPPAVELTFEGCAARPDRAVVVREVATLLKTIESHTGKPTLLAIDRNFDDAYQISAIVRPLWLNKAYFPPGYGARGWTMWRANPRRWVDGIEHPAHWDVVRP